MSEENDAILRALIEEDWQKPVPPPVIALAEKAKASLGLEEVAAILFYGSCYRDGVVGDGLVDLYLLVENLEATTMSWLSKRACQLVPPNVYFVQTQFEGRTIRAKFAVICFDEFEKRLQPDCTNPYFWARFAQPTGVVEVQSAYQNRLIRAFTTAIRTLYGHAKALVPEQSAPETLWPSILIETYKTELRVEKPDRALQIYKSNQLRFDKITKTLSGESALGPKTRSWRRRRTEGKLLSVLRLMKAAFTFVGGADYLVWKIERHSGVEVKLADWQRRHPILGALPVLWRLWRARIIS